MDNREETDPTNIKSIPEMALFISKQLSALATKADVNDRLEKIEHKVEKTNGRMDDLEQRIEVIKRQSLERTISVIDKPLLHSSDVGCGKAETRITARKVPTCQEDDQNMAHTGDQ